MSLKILLLQARRADDPMREQEVGCFVAQSGIPREGYTPWNLTEGPPTLAEVRRHDAVMVGGSGDFYVSKRDLPHFEPLLELLREIVQARHPTFASCFGYQCLVEALGGKIIHDPDNLEVGTFECTLTEAGRADPLLSTLPGRFQAQMGHKDRAQVGPPGTANLASSERSPNQAFRIPDAPIWATQFHPELSGDANLARYKHYLNGYAGHLTQSEVQATFERFRPSPEASHLLKDFVDLVFG
ncbi:MAG: type 1 glutamine amidotransferase [Deltaproteobacteria bacterium]|nr:type 1 glutamine amidotransferase [Deltaproteobacteria bacterium]